MHAATTVSLIPVLSDNYVFVLHGGGSGAAVVDPAVAEPVIAWLEERGLELEAILHTHHHNDHIGGTPGLLQRWPQAAVIASAADHERIPLQTQGVQGGDHLALLGRNLRVLEVPGHTRHHIAYVLEPQAEEAAELARARRELEDRTAELVRLKGVLRGELLRRVLEDAETTRTSLGRLDVATDD